MVFALQWLIYHACAMKIAIPDDPIGLQDLYFVTSPQPGFDRGVGRYIEHPVLPARRPGRRVAIVALWRWEKPVLPGLWAAQMVLLAGIRRHDLRDGGPAAAMGAAGTTRTSLVPMAIGAMPAILHGGLMSYPVYTHNENMQYLPDRRRDRLCAACWRRCRSKPGPPKPTQSIPDVVVIPSESLFDSTIMKGMAGACR